MTREELVVVHEHRRCDADDPLAPGGKCPKTVTCWAQVPDYTGPVFCRRHAHLANVNPDAVLREQ